MDDMNFQHPCGVCIADIYFVIKAYLIHGDIDKAIAKRSIERGRTKNTIFDAISRRLYGVGAYKPKDRFVDEIGDRRILNSIFARFDLPEIDKQKFRSLFA